MAIAVWNIKESRYGIHYPIFLYVLNRLCALNIWSRINFVNDCMIDWLHINVHFMFGTLLSVYWIVWFLIYACLIWFYVVVIVWFRPRCIFLYFKIIFKTFFCIFLVLQFSLCCFMVVCSMGFCGLSGNLK